MSELKSTGTIPSISPYKEKILTRKEKRAKSKHLKKILKDRLNIDCLRMLGEESSDEDDDKKNRKSAKMLNGDGAVDTKDNDSYLVLMKEIGHESNEGLS